MSYKSTRRHWVKLWVAEWLDGTTRFELTAEQRLLWVDLLALAGRSRFPGMIYAGDGEGGKRVGYPVTYLSGILGIQIEPLQDALSVLVRHKHIQIQETAPECLLIVIVNWEKYQSEYQRQKTTRTQKVRTKTRRSAQEVTPKNTMRLQVEGEGEVEEEEEKKNPSPPKPMVGSQEFLVFWDVYPRKVDRKEALRAWVKGGLDGSLGDVLAGLAAWKSTEQWTDVEKIPYPSTWLHKQRWKESPRPVGTIAGGENLYERAKRMEREAGISR